MNDVLQVARLVCGKLGVPEPKIAYLPLGTDDAYYDGETISIAPNASVEWVLHELAHHCNREDSDGHGERFSRQLVAVRKAWFDA